jgi:hypothetical protein
MLVLILIVETAVAVTLLGVLLMSIRVARRHGHKVN